MDRLALLCVVVARRGQTHQRGALFLRHDDAQALSIAGATLAWRHRVEKSNKPALGKACWHYNEWRAMDAA